ncbi:hypothetical protein D3C79_647930 [compost metagenome]
MLRRRRMRRRIGEAVKARQRFDQAVEHQGRQLAFAQETLRAGLWMGGFPVVFDHAGQQRQRVAPALPAATAQPRNTEVRDDAQVLALLAQVKPGRLFNVNPVDRGFLQPAQLDHLLVNGLVGFVLHIEQPSRDRRINRCKQPSDVLRRHLRYHRHVLRTWRIKGSRPCASKISPSTSL